MKPQPTDQAAEDAAAAEDQADGFADEVPAVSYPLSQEEIEEIDARFTHHPPQEDQPERYFALRANARELAFQISAEVPPSRERSLALTKLQEAVMWANAGIACRE